MVLFFGGAMLDCYGVRTLLKANIFITLAGLIIAICSIVMIRGRKNSEGV